MAGEEARRWRRGEHVQLCEIPGLVGVVIADLYGCEPPMVQVSFNIHMATPACIETARLERVVFDPQAQDWRAEQEGDNGD